MTTLITSFYQDKNEARNLELLTCLVQNCNNKKIDRILLIVDEKLTIPILDDKISVVYIPNRPTYQDAISLAGYQCESKEHLFIIANADIYFDETNIGLIDLYLCNDQLFALSRWDGTGKNDTIYNHPDSQDVWCFKGFPKTGNYDFIIGIPGCDNRVAYEFDNAGYEVTNPALSIKTYHLHKTGIRNYTRNTVVPPPYKILELTSLFDYLPINVNSFSNQNAEIKPLVNPYNTDVQRAKLIELSKTKLTPKYKWGIIILTIESRRKEYKELYIELTRQIKENNLENKVKIYPVVDNGYYPIGYKRNEGMIIADAEYINHFDDDDCPSKDYIKSIYNKMKEGNDVITFDAEVTYDGENPETMFFDLKYKSNKSFISQNLDGTFIRYRHRMPCHLNPIKKSIALNFPFKIIGKPTDKNRKERGDRGSDVEQSLELVNRAALKTQSKINKTLYYYKYKQGKI